MSQRLRSFAANLIAAVQFLGRIAVSVHNAFNRVIANRTGKKSADKYEFYHRNRFTGIVCYRTAECCFSGELNQLLLQVLIVVAFGAFCFGFGCGYLTAFIVTRTKWRDEMIKRGVARYN